MGRKIGFFGLINYRRHPENPNYIVFGFNSEKEAAIFEQELNHSGTRFEKDTEQTDDGIVYLFAVTEASMDEATKANARVKSATREPLFKNIFARYTLFFLFFLLIVFAIVGYVKNSKNTTETVLKTDRDTTKFVQ